MALAALIIATASLVLAMPCAVLAVLQLRDRRDHSRRPGRPNPGSTQPQYVIADVFLVGIDGDPPGVVHLVRRRAMVDRLPCEQAVGVVARCRMSGCATA